MTRLHFVNRSVLPLRAELFLAGAHCSLATNSEQLLSTLSSWRASVVLPASLGRFEMDLRVDAELPPADKVKTQIQFRGLHHLVFAALTAHELLAYDLLRRRVSGVISSQRAKDAEFWNTLWLPITIGVMGTTVGVVPLHSACLDYEGQGLLICGECGAGKSTLAVALAQRGFSLISDDWTYVSREGTGLAAYGMSVPVKLLPDAVRYFPELRRHVPGPSFNGELAFEVDAATVFRAKVQRKSAPRWLMFLQRDPLSGCEFVPFQAAQASEFFERSAERLPAEIPEGLAIRSELIRTIVDCELWLVRSGESPQKTAEAIGEFCSRN